THQAPAGGGADGCRRRRHRPAHVRAIRRVLDAVREQPWRSAPGAVLAAAGAGRGAGVVRRPPRPAVKAAYICSSVELYLTRTNESPERSPDARDLRAAGCARAGAFHAR